MLQVRQKKNESDLFNSITLKRVDGGFESGESVWKISKKGTKELKIEYFWNYMHIHPFKLKLNYSVSASLMKYFRKASGRDNVESLNESQNDTASKHKNSLLNFMMSIVAISDMKIKIKEYIQKDSMEIQELMSSLIQFYLDDLIYNQRLNILAGVYPIRFTINIYKAFQSLISHPLNSYFNDKHILVGVMQGLTDFINRLSNEFGDIGSKLL